MNRRSRSRGPGANLAPDVYDVANVGETAFNASVMFEDVLQTSSAMADSTIGSIVGLATAVRIMKGLYKIANGTLKRVYATNIAKLSRVGTALTLIGSQLAVEGLCIDDSALQLSIKQLDSFLANHVLAHRVQTVFDPNAVESKVTAMIADISMSWGILLGDVTMLLLAKQSKLLTPSMRAWLERNRSTCVPKMRFTDFTKGAMRPARSARSATRIPTRRSRRSSRASRASRPSQKASSPYHGWTKF